MGYGTDGLTFNTLRRANLARLPCFRDSKGRVCHSEKDGSDWTPAQWLQAVVGELGEYANLRKKVERGDMTMDEARPMLADELADVVIYLDILAEQLDVNLGDAVMAKWNRTSERVGCNMYIDAEDWHYSKPASNWTLFQQRHLGCSMYSETTVAKHAPGCTAPMEHEWFDPKGHPDNVEAK